MTVEPFRVRPGDDASCLNLYEPTNPRILGASRRFVDSGRFAFQSSLASTDVERMNPWQLLNREISDGNGPIVPVIADANSITYVLHKKVGDDVVLDRGGHPARLRLVAALEDSIFQSELVMSDANFAKHSRPSAAQAAKASARTSTSTSTPSLTSTITADRTASLSP